MLRDWLIGLGVATACVVVSWGVLWILARRLPSGILRDLAAFISDCVTAGRRLRKDPRVPRRAKIAIVIAGIWVARPIDLIPEFIPVLGPLDDIVVVALALRYAGRLGHCRHHRADGTADSRLLAAEAEPARRNVMRARRPGRWWGSCRSGAGCEVPGKARAAG